MVYLLLEKGTMTAPQLAAYFEVSVRTIYRDIDILSAAGIPIYASQGRGGGISIQDNYVLKKSMLSQEEQKHILMALQSMQVIEAVYSKGNMLTGWKLIFQAGPKAVPEKSSFRRFKTQS